MKEDVDLIREVFNYSKRFKGATFVFKIDCLLFDDPFFPSLMRDLALLHSNDIKIVLIAGARSKIDEVLGKYEISHEVESGVRISSDEAIEFIKMAAFDVSNKLMTLLSAHEANAVIGNWVRARSLGVIDGKDYKKTGIVDKISVDLIKKIQSEGLIPIFPCIGWSSVGTPYNISSNELARVVSIQLDADKLFFLNSLEGFKSDNLFVPNGAYVTEEGRISRLNTNSAREFIDKNASSTNENMEYVEMGIAACNGGVKRVHILDGRNDGVILKEIFSSLGSGIMIHSNIHDSIRPMIEDDATDVFGLMQPLIEKEILVSRSEDEIREMWADYYVYAVDGALHGSAALHDFDNGVGEIAGIAVDSSYVYLGIGQKLVCFLLDKAREQKYTKIFALTTQAVDWFEQLGFRESTVDELPEKKRESYNRKRNSRIMMIDL